MKIKEIDGKKYLFLEKDEIKYLILEEGNEINLTTPEEYGLSHITVKNNANKLDVLTSSPLIGKINGKGILKADIEKILSTEEIINKCDRWIEIFKQIHDIFKELTLSTLQDTTTLALSSTSLIFSLCVLTNNHKGKTINLNMQQYKRTILEGMNLSIDDENSAVYKYIMANVLSYYLSQNCLGIQFKDSTFNWTIYSNIEREENSVVPMWVQFNAYLTEETTYCKLIKNLLTCHNIGIPTDQIISNLKEDITNQAVYNLDKDIEYSAKQLEFLLQLKKHPITTEFSRNL